jgi:predicted nuclease with RNAse H fold
MYGYGIIGDASPNSTFYIDDILQTNASGSIGVESITLEQGVAVFPNPANDYITLSSETAKMEVVSLFDFMGNQVLETYPNSNKTTIPISDLPSGVYMAIVATKYGLSKVKLLVE